MNTPERVRFAVKHDFWPMCRVSDRSGTPQRSEEYSEERGPEGETPKTEQQPTP